MALRPTLLQYAAIWIQLLPPLAGVATGRLRTAARRWTAVWCLGLVVADHLARVIALLVGRNLWLTYLMTPATASTGLWALSCWQRGSGRLALRVAIPLLVLVGAVLTVRAEDFQSFSLFVIPFYALVLLLAAAWTFIRRSFAESALLLRQDWFWCVGAMMLYYGASMALNPVASYLLGVGREDLLHYMFNLKAGMDVLVFAAITGGVLCPLPPTSSGGASSSPSSPSASWSAPSA